MFLDVASCVIHYIGMVGYVNCVAKAGQRKMEIEIRHVRGIACTVAPLYVSIMSGYRSPISRFPIPLPISLFPLSLFLSPLLLLSFPIHSSAMHPYKSLSHLL